MTYQKSSKLHIVAVVAVIRNAAGKYLVLKRSEQELAYPGLYTFPGGKMEENDTVEETLMKEVTEEAGLEIRPEKILLKDKAFIRPDGQTVKVFSYLCFLAEEKSVHISQDFTDFKWVTLAELRQLPHVGIEEELIQAQRLYDAGIDLSLLPTKSQKQE